MVRTFGCLSLSLCVLVTPVLAQQTTEQQQSMEELQKMQEMQQKSMDIMTNSLPTISSFMNSIIGATRKLEEMKKERINIFQTKTDELEAKVEEVLELLDAGKKSRAKLKALSIKWTPIGTAHLDKEREEYFDNIRNKLIDLIEES